MLLIAEPAPAPAPAPAPRVLFVVLEDGALYFGVGGAELPVEFEVEVVRLPPEGYRLSVPAVVVPDVAVLRLPAGAPIEPNACAA